MSSLETTWKGLKQGNGQIRGSNFGIPVAMPESYGGTGDGANPKDLLTASAVSCYVMTLAGLLQSHSILVDNISVTTEMTGDKPQNLHILHTVDILLSEGSTVADEQSTGKLIHTADDVCMIGNLLKTSGVKISVSGSVKKS